ncbi:response regulator [Halospeciosus flavus]|uniref:Response regulator n=1 Tax=Halospeciosus flavus TaxID=3032283 RepID=A0ABD5Z4B9_9EURY|nr:response regulator [Halospeciosus flavus]
MTKERETTQREETTILAVDDLPEYLELYEARLGDRYDVETAEGGEEALDKLDDEVDVVLLDRSMPGLSGDEALARIRDSDYDCRVAMVTAVEPDVDVIDLGFDAYLTKPVSKETLVDTVERLLQRSQYDEEVADLYRLCTKRAVVRQRVSESDVSESEEFRELQSKIRERRDVVDDLVADFDHDDFRATFRDLPSTE